ncbi:MAG: T9SS type A sorting domain-containing protein [Bacteroidia bacterium]|nr:T9SS type A sorting domain-containing protein [Bacteroidia bacterium]
MNRLFIFTLLALFFGINNSIGQVVNSDVIKYQNQWDDDDGDNTPEIDDIILKVTPNPAGQEAEVVFKNLPGDGEATMRLLDLTGKVYQQVKVGGVDARSGSIRLATERLTTGLYIVHLTTAWGDIAKRVLIK